MIPKEQLVKLKPIKDIENRKKEIKGKQSISRKKGRLTKRARQYASFPEMKIKTSTGGKGMPKGQRWIGKPKHEDKKK